MNYSKIEVIGIAHGWSMMKTVSQVFVTGAREIRTSKKRKDRSRYISCSWSSFNKIWK